MEPIELINEKLVNLHGIYFDQTQIHFNRINKTLTSKRNYSTLLHKWIDKYSSVHLINSLSLIQPYKSDATDTEIIDWIEYFLERLPRIAHWKYKIGDGGADVEHLAWCLKNNSSIETYERTKIFLILKHAILEGFDKSKIFILASTVSTVKETTKGISK